MKKIIYCLCALFLIGCDSSPSNSIVDSIDISKCHTKPMEVVDFIMKTKEEVIEKSTLIVRGKYNMVQNVAINPFVPDGSYYFTKYKIDILEVLKGSLSDETLSVWLKGTHTPFVADDGECYYYIPTVNEKRENIYYFDETIREDREYIFGLILDGEVGYRTAHITNSIFLVDTYYAD